MNPKRIAFFVVCICSVIAALFVLFGCADGPVHPTSSTAAVAADVTKLSAQAIQDFTDYKAGNANLTWSLAAGAAAYKGIVQTVDDVRQLVHDWVGNSGDSQKLADRLARIFADSRAPASQKAAAIELAAKSVAANTSP